MSNRRSSCRSRSLIRRAVCAGWQRCEAWAGESRQAQRSAGSPACCDGAALQLGCRTPTACMNLQQPCCAASVAPMSCPSPGRCPRGCRAAAPPGCPPAGSRARRCTAWLPALLCCSTSEAAVPFSEAAVLFHEQCTACALTAGAPPAAGWSEPRDAAWRPLPTRQPLLAVTGVPVCMAAAHQQVSNADAGSGRRSRAGVPLGGATPCGAWTHAFVHSCTNRQWRPAALPALLRAGRRAQGLCRRHRPLRRPLADRVQAIRRSGLRDRARGRAARARFAEGLLGVWERAAGVHRDPSE